MSIQPDGSGFIPRVQSFGDRLALLRHRLGLSRKAAAAKCALDDASWANWERSNSRPRDFPTVVQAISDNLGADRDWLMWGHDGGAPDRANLSAEGRLLSSRAA